MKQVKGKYIRMTEQQMSHLIAEEVKKQLQMIMEYAIPRDKFVDNAFNLSQQIVENWCLVHYCTITNTDVNKCKNHWKNELETHMNHIWRNTIKCHKDFDTRYNAIIQGFDYNDLFEDKKRIIILTKNKFKKEGIDIKSTEYFQTCTDCFNAVKSIIEVMADFKNNNIDEYIETI